MKTKMGLSEDIYTEGQAAIQLAKEKLQTDKLIDWFVDV